MPNRGPDARRRTRKDKTCMRSELKYVLPNSSLPSMRRAIEPFMDLDGHCRGREEEGYTVRSVYLDSPDLRYYHEKHAHLQDRMKVRIRGYDQPEDDAEVFLEIKRKFNSKIAKERAPVSYGAVRPLFESGRYADYIRGSSSRALDTGRRVLYHVHRDRLGPTCLVVYEREAFEGRFDRTFRITLDRNLRGAICPGLDGLFCDEGMREVLPGFFILEIKFNTRMPAWTRQIIAAFGLIQCSASKYCLCVDRFDRRLHSKVSVIAAPPPIVATNGVGAIR